MRYANVSCSQCGRDFGPGDHGFSHCEDHPGHVADMKEWQTQLLRIAAKLQEQAEEIDPYRDDPGLTASELRHVATALREVLGEMRPVRRRAR